MNIDRFSPVSAAPVALSAAPAVPAARPAATPKMSADSAVLSSGLRPAAPVRRPTEQPRTLKQQFQRMAPMAIVPTVVLSAVGMSVTPFLPLAVFTGPVGVALSLGSVGLGAVGLGLIGAWMFMS